MSSASTSKRPHWQVSVVTALAAGMLTILARSLPSMATGVIVVIVVTFIGMMWLNPAHRLWRVASGCFGVAGAAAIVPEFQLAVDAGELAFVLHESGSSPAIVGMFLVAGFALAWLDVWRSSSPESGVVVTNPSTLAEAIRLARADPSEAIAAGCRAIGGQTEPAEGDASSRSRQIALAIVCIVAAIVMAVLTFLLLRSSAERSPTLALARSRRGR